MHARPAPPPAATLGDHPDSLLAAIHEVGSGPADEGSAPPADRAAAAPPAPSGGLLDVGPGALQRRLPRGRELEHDHRAARTRGEHHARAQLQHDGEPHAQAGGGREARDESGAGQRPEVDPRALVADRDLQALLTRERLVGTAAGVLERVVERLPAVLSRSVWRIRPGKLVSAARTTARRTAASCAGAPKTTGGASGVPSSSATCSSVRRMSLPPVTASSTST